MTTQVLETGYDLDVVRETGTYIVTDPTGLAASTYLVKVTEATTAAGARVVVQEVIDVATGVPQTRISQGGAQAAWLGGGGVTEESATTGAAPIELDPGEAEVRFQITSGGTAGDETVEFVAGQWFGQRLVVEFGVRTNAADRIVIDDTNLRVWTGHPSIGTNLPFDDTLVTPYRLVAAGDSAMFQWGDGGWLYMFGDPPAVVE